MVQPDWPQQNKILSMRFACWITKATDTHSQCVIFIALPRQEWLGERASILRLYVNCLSCLTQTPSRSVLFLARSFINKLSVV
jgi:hypothetical protein